MKNSFKVIAVNIIILFLFLAAFELGLRFFWKMSSLKGVIYRNSANRALRYELKPNLNVRYENYQVITNSDGFRGREYSIEKPKGTFRIVMVGDSFAFGRFLNDDTLARRLEVVLANYCPGSNFEVLNMGVEGYNSIQELEMLRAKGLKYSPDMVIVYYCLNDPDYPEYFLKKNFWSDHFLLPRYVFYKMKKHQIKKDRKKRGVVTQPENFKYLYTTECWQNTKGAVMEMAELSAAKGARMVLLIAPEMSEAVKDFREGYPYWYINEMLEGIKHNNIVVIDPIREFSRLDLKKKEIANWTYPNAQANDIIANYVIQELQKSGIKLCN